MNNIEYGLVCTFIGDISTAVARTGADYHGEWFYIGAVEGHLCLLTMGLELCHKMFEISRSSVDFDAF